jgi:hypothetical protein
MAELQRLGRAMEEAAPAPPLLNRRRPGAREARRRPSSRAMGRRTKTQGVPEALGFLFIGGGHGKGQLAR